MLEKNPYFQKALTFIGENNLLSFAPGTYIIEEGNVWVNIVEKDLHPLSEAVLEAHDEFIDIHIPFTGAESYGIKARALCRHPKGGIDKDEDIIFYDDEIESILTKTAGEMTVFEADMAHAPLIGNGHIKKAIFKVRIV